MKTIYDLLNDVKENPEDRKAAELTGPERARMKRSFRRAAGLPRKRAARWTAAAACLVCLIGVSQTAFAKTAVNGILQRINLGHISVVREDPDAKPKMPKIYDREGRRITNVPKGKPTEIYDENGKSLGMVGTAEAGDRPDNYVVEKDLNKAKQKLAFRPLLPAKLPAGYRFDHAGFYLDENGKISGDYVDLYYTGGGARIFVQERRNTPETAAETGAETVKKLKINGRDAVLLDGAELDWETDKVSVYLITQKNLSEQQLVALAESFQ